MSGRIAVASARVSSVLKLSITMIRSIDESAASVRSMFSRSLNVMINAVSSRMAIFFLAHPFIKLDQRRADRFHRKTSVDETARVFPKLLAKDVVAQQLPHRLHQRVLIARYDHRGVLPFGFARNCDLVRQDTGQSGGQRFRR